MSEHTSRWACSGAGGRGCPCEWHVWKRAYQRDRKRAQRKAALDVERSGRYRCPKKVGRHGVCGGKLRDTTDGAGRVVVVCDRCERQARGTCARCPNPAYGPRARWCRSCLKVAARDARRRHYYAHVEQMRRRARDYYRDPEHKAQRDAYRTAWDKAFPELRQAQKARSAAKHRDTRLRYLKSYRQHQTGGPASPRVDGYRLCLTCDAVMTGKKKRCRRCKERDRVRAVAFLESQGCSTLARRRSA